MFYSPPLSEKRLKTSRIVSLGSSDWGRADICEGGAGVSSCAAEGGRVKECDGRGGSSGVSGGVGAVSLTSTGACRR